MQIVKKGKRHVVFLSQRREEPHNTEVQVAQTTDAMKEEMGRTGSFLWADTDMLGVKFQIRLIDQDPLGFLGDRKASTESSIRAMQIAREQGADTMGLGSLVASVAHGGIDYLDAATAGKFRLDHGDDGSTALAVDAALQIRQTYDRPFRHIGVVGAVGVMGAGFIRILAQLLNGISTVTFVVNDESDSRAKMLAIELIAKGITVNISSRLQDLAELGCDLVYLASSSPHAILRPKHVMPGAIILDACIPPAVIPRIFDGSQNLIVPVGCGEIPWKLAPKGFGVDLGMGKSEHGFTAYGCMIGCIIGAHMGDQVDRVGPVDPNYALRLLQKFHEFGIRAQPFPYPLDEIERFRRLHAA